MGWFLCIQRVFVLSNVNVCYRSQHSDHVNHPFNVSMEVPHTLVTSAVIVVHQPEENSSSRLHLGHAAEGDGVVAAGELAGGDVHPAVTTAGPVGVVVLGTVL